MSGTKTGMSYNVSITFLPNFMIIQYHMSIPHQIYQHVSHELAQSTTRDEKIAIKLKMPHKIPQKFT